MRFAVSEKLISSAPFIPMPRKPAPKTAYLEKEQAQAVASAAMMPHVKLFICLALATAGRVSAILELTWDRVDMEGRTIRLATGGAGEATKGRATVPINEMAFRALQEAQAGAVSDFVVEWGGGPIARITKGVAAASRRAGIACTPHTLRHTAAVWMAGAGVPMSKIAQYLGHSDSRTTERVYARYAPDHLRDAASALEL
jgi:integrase